MKVKFGLSHVNFFVLTETTDPDTGITTMSYGAKIPAPGAVNLSLNVSDSDVSPFYADDGVYYMPAKKSSGMTGELELALIPDDLKTAAMNYYVDEDGVMCEAAESKNVFVGMTFEIDSDDKARKLVYYKMQLGQPNLSASTTEDQKTPATDTLPITVLPTTAEFTFGTGADAVETSVISGYSTEDTDATAYTNWHTAPHLPAEA